MRLTPQVKLLAIVLLIIVLIICNFAGLGSGNYWDGKDNVTISVTGDVMIARNVAGVLGGQGSAYSGIGDALSNSDIVLINFENAATTEETAVKEDIPFKTDPSNIGAVVLNTKVVAGIANNHVFDYGTQGARDTIKNLEANGISAIGAGENASDASEPFVYEVGGRKITILNYMDPAPFAAYSQEVMPQAGEATPGYSAYNESRMVSQIHEARENGSDFVLVYFHFGNEYVTSPNANQVDFAHTAIDAGADTVVGSHPHVPQGFEVYNNKTIFYSLGDTVFDLETEGTTESYIVTFELVGGTCKATVRPVALSGYLPHFMDAEEGKTFLASLTPACDDMVINSDGTGTIVFNLTNPNDFK